MMRMQWVASNFCPYLFWGFCFQTRVSRGFSARCGGSKMQLVAFFLSCLGIGFWYKFVPPSNGCSTFNKYPLHR